MATAAKQKKRMNQGQWMRALLFLAIAVPTDSGTIPRARASLTVVPTASATAPNFAVAPTTELVSWMASAAQRPNWVWVRCSAVPIAGNASKATGLSRNTGPRETAIPSSLALVMGAIAAMALPPQIAVPAVMRNEVPLLYGQQPYQRPAKQHGEADAARGVEEAGATDAKNLLQIHTESKAHHGGLQKNLGEMFCFDVKRVNEGESVEDAAHQRNRGRD